MGKLKIINVQKKEKTMSNYFTFTLFWFTFSVSFNIHSSFDTKKMFAYINEFKEEWNKTFGKEDKTESEEEPEDETDSDDEKVDDKDNNKEVNDNDSNTDL